MPVSSTDITIDGAVRRRPHSRDALAATAHPGWTAQMLERLRPDWDAVVDCEVFTSTTPGSVPEEKWRRVILEFFCVVESFPKYMGITLAKTTFGRYPKDELARNWLIGNIRIEARHAQWYIDWAAAHGIGREELLRHRPHAAVAGLDAWLWSVAQRGSLAEAIAAVNYAIEGTTGEWTRLVLPAFAERYDHDKKGLAWLANHAEYDDEHPIQALEIVKDYLGAAGAPAQAELDQTENAIRRSLELFRNGFEDCFTRG